MRESGCYPAGAEFDSRAPYNEKRQEARPFEIELCHVIYLKPTINSREYEGGDYNDEGFYEHPKYIGDARGDFEAQYATLKQTLETAVQMMMKRATELSETYRARDSRSLRWINQTARNEYNDLMRAINTANVYIKAEGEIEAE